MQINSSGFCALGPCMLSSAVRSQHGLPASQRLTRALAARPLQAGLQVFEPEVPKNENNNNDRDNSNDKKDSNHSNTEDNNMVLGTWSQYTRFEVSIEAVRS